MYQTRSPGLSKTKQTDENEATVQELKFELSNMSEHIKALSDEIKEVKTILNELKDEKRAFTGQTVGGKKSVCPTNTSRLKKYLLKPPYATFLRCLAFIVPFGYYTVYKYKSYRFNNLPFVLILSLLCALSQKFSITLICTLFLYRFIPRPDS